MWWHAEENLCSVLAKGLNFLTVESRGSMEGWLVPEVSQGLWDNSFLELHGKHLVLSARVSDTLCHDLNPSVGCKLSERFHGM